MSHKHPRYEELDARGKALGDKNYCGVIAVAVITGETFDAARARLEAIGRRRRKGTPTALITKAIEDKGFRKVELTEAEHRTISGCKTMNQMGKRAGQLSGNYCVYTRTHVAAVTGGRLVDWTEGRRHQVVYAHKFEKVTPAPKPIRPEPPAMPVIVAKPSGWKLNGKRDRQMRLF